MCIVTTETLNKSVIWGQKSFKKSQQSKRFLFAFLCYTVTAKRLFVEAAAVGEM